MYISFFCFYIYIYIYIYIFCLIFVSPPLFSIPNFLKYFRQFLPPSRRQLLSCQAAKLNDDYTVCWRKLN